MATCSQEHPADCDEADTCTCEHEDIWNFSTEEETDEAFQSWEQGQRHSLELDGALQRA